MSKQFYFKPTSLAKICNLSVKIVLFQTIQFSLSMQIKCQNNLISILFNISTEFSSIWSVDRTLIRCYHSRPKRIWEWWQWSGTQFSPKLQHKWNLTIRLVSVISRILIVAVVFFTPLQRSSQCILQPQPTGHIHCQMCVCVYIYIYICLYL